MTIIRRATDERLTELARGIVRGDYLIADTSREWLHSLFMLGPALSKVTNLGVVLVPVAVHTRGLWLNGRVPGVTLEVVTVAKGDMPALRRKVDTMNAALFPNEREPE